MTALRECVSSGGGEVPCPGGGGYSRVEVLEGEREGRVVLMFRMSLRPGGSG
jgi:hypothetical protein